MNTALVCDIGPKLNNPRNSEGSFLHAPDGDILFAFDPEFALDFRLGCFHTWDADKKQLTLQMNGKTLVYTIGKDTYTLHPL